MTAPAVDGGRFTPAPGAAPLGRMVRAQTRSELVTQLRNGEQLLLILVIPTLLLVLFSVVDVVSLGPGRRVDYLLPGILALAVMSTAFTGQAIGTGFERRYGVLKRLGSTPLPRSGLLAAKTLAVLAVELGQLVLLLGVGALLGWRPGNVHWLTVLLLLALGTAAFSGLGLLMAGTLRAEATLALANLVYLLLLLAGGIVVPLDRFPAGTRPALEALPSTALAEGLRTAFSGGPTPWGPIGVLSLWAAGSLTAAALTFRWE
jgi:ABC-2 type transport system permease protein